LRARREIVRVTPAMPPPMTATEKGFEEEVMSLLASKSCSSRKVRVYLNRALRKVHAFLSDHYSPHRSSFAER
jgi:hypothetical protein